MNLRITKDTLLSSPTEERRSISGFIFTKMGLQPGQNSGKCVCDNRILLLSFSLPVLKMILLFHAVSQMLFNVVIREDQLT